MSLTWKRVFRDGAAHPETGGLCEVDVPIEGATHPGRCHVYTEWVDGEPSHPVYWDDPPVTGNEQMFEFPTARETAGDAQAEAALLFSAESAVRADAPQVPPLAIVMAEYDRRAAAIQRVREKHRPDHEGDCEECYQTHPCPTVRALVGDTTSTDRTPTNWPARLAAASDAATDLVGPQAAGSAIDLAAIAAWSSAIDALSGLAEALQPPHDPVAQAILRALDGDTTKES